MAAHHEREGLFQAFPGAAPQGLCAGDERAHARDHEVPAGARCCKRERRRGVSGEERCGAGRFHYREDKGVVEK